jgi:multicomponent Na+:H+ antiporter subunit A
MILAAVLSGFLLAPIAAALHRFTPRHSAWIMSLLPFGLALYFASYLDAIAAGTRFTETTPWVPGLEIDLAFRLDGLSVVFALLITGIGGFILVYAGGYLKGHPHLGRMLVFLLMFMASMLGVVLADNLLVLFVFWELTSVTSYLLIGFDHARERARAAALQALLVTGAGGLALLAGALILQQITGTLSISTMLDMPGVIQGHALYVPALLLILAGAFTKSAQFPFHFWLPNAMEAPTPVSAYLHSATMVKAGIYLLARMHPALGGTEWWSVPLTVFGGITMVFGAKMAFLKTDLKQILAYTTVSALGMLTFALGLGGELGVPAAVVFLIAHSLYKGALFMVAGAVDHEAGTRNIEELGGLRRTMPVTALAAGFAAFSMAGLPPLFGFVSKELFYEASQSAAAYQVILIAAAVATGVLTVAAAGLAGIRPFFGAETKTPKAPHEAPISLWLGPVTLALAGLLLGLLPGLAGTRVVSRAASEILNSPISVKLSLYHGINVTLLLSALTIATGIGLYLLRDRIQPKFAYFGGPLRWGPEGGYETLLAGMMRFATAQTRLLQNGLLPHYLRIVLITAIVLVGVALSRSTGPPQENLLRDVRPYEAVTALLIVVAAISAVVTRSRLAAFASLGVVALGLAQTFVLFGAPDLAMTQFLVETLTVILLVLVIYHLPVYTIQSSARQRFRDAVVAIAAGSLFTILVLGVTSVQLAPAISRYYVENSYKLAHGQNVVNVILVDFRSLDTLGEITVLAIAAVGVFALLKLRPERGGAK